MARAPGSIRDSIIGYLSTLGGEASAKEISAAVAMQVGGASPSSVRSYLNLNAADVFERTGRGRYRLRGFAPVEGRKVTFEPAFSHGLASLYQADRFDWLAAQDPCSIHAVVTDPPYGLVEYTEKEQSKLRNGRGGIWRIDR